MRWSCSIRRAPGRGSPGRAQADDDALAERRERRIVPGQRLSSSSSLAHHPPSVPDEIDDEVKHARLRDELATFVTQLAPLLVELESAESVVQRLPSDR